MRILNIKNKKADSVSILILVLLSLGLVGITLLVFNSDMAKVSAEVKGSGYLNDVYLREGKIDFYINNIMEKSILKVQNRENPVPEFSDYFKEELLKYKQNGTFVIEEFSQVEEQIKNENIGFNSEKKEITLNLNFKIDRNFENQLMISHSYGRKYIKKI